MLDHQELSILSSFTIDIAIAHFTMVSGRHWSSYVLIYMLSASCRNLNSDCRLLWLQVINRQTDAATRRVISEACFKDVMANFAASYHGLDIAF